MKNLKKKRAVARCRHRWVDGRILRKWSFKKYRVKAWIGFIWLRIGTSGRLLLLL